MAGVMAESRNVVQEKYTEVLPVVYFIKTSKNASCEYDRRVVETQLCKLRDTSDTLIGRACAMFQLKYGVCELHLRYGC